MASELQMDKRKYICQILSIPENYVHEQSKMPNTFCCKVNKLWVHQLIAQINDKGICKDFNTNSKDLKMEMPNQVIVVKWFEEGDQLLNCNEIIPPPAFFDTWKNLVNNRMKNESMFCVKNYSKSGNKLTTLKGSTEIGLTATMSLPLLGKVKDNRTELWIYDYYAHSVQDALFYSPSLLNCSTTHIKPMFIIYQVLQNMIFNNNICKQNYTWDKIMIDSKYWLYISPEHLRKNTVNKLSSEISKIETSADNHLYSVTQKWICGKMSNFDYLMRLNKVAGRQMGNPSNHPILPWVSDLISKTNSWRDLTKSKYRLNKGDKQLDLQYTLTKELKQSRDGSKEDIPHHIPEFLSDITYYVYKSRQTNKDILCKLVRSYWEPNEYPASIQRMQEWTPEECIPEFYTDPSIFHSIHEDMLDLAVPNWAESAEDFIAKHREMLESDEVSQDLHHWIDLTFGYKLGGKDALKSKNVCLPMVDQHVTLRNHGINQIFQQPHPKKFSLKSSKVMNLNNIMDELDFLEQNMKFYSSNAISGNNDILNEYYHNKNCELLSNYTERQSISQNNAACFICLCFELYMAPYMRSCAIATQEILERLVHCINCFQANKSKLAVSVVLFLEKLLCEASGLVESMNEQREVIFNKPISNFDEIITFPAYFSDLYQTIKFIMQQTNNYRKPLRDSAKLGNSISELLSNIQDSNDCVKILIPHILALLEFDLNSNSITLVSVFDPIANCLNIEKTNKWFLAPVLKIYSDAITSLHKLPTNITELSTVHMLFKKTVLIQLVVRFGCLVFLESFPKFLCEGLIYCPSGDIVNEFWLMKKFGPTSASKFVIPFLFRALEACFEEKNQVKDTDLVSSNIMKCFIAAADLYGPQMITGQFFPHIYHRISSAMSGKVTSLSALEGNVCCLIWLVPYLSDAAIMENINHLHTKILTPVLQYIIADDNLTNFANKHYYQISTKFVKLLSILSYRVGREMALQHFSDIIKESLLRSGDYEQEEENHDPTQDLVCILYLDLYKLLDRQLDAMLGNQMDSIIKLLPQNRIMTKATLLRVENAKSVVVGNKIVVSNLSTALSQQKANIASLKNTSTEKYSDSNIRKELNVLANKSTQLSDNWLAYWGHEIGLADTDKHIHFNQIELGHFQSHSSAIRSLYVHPNEDWFASSGRDKLVKLWSLETCNSSSQEAYCYNLHKKSVNYIGVINYDFQMVTADSTMLHVWDPFTGNQLRTIDSNDLSASISSVATTQMSQPLCIVATSDNVLHLVDTRLKSCVHRYRSTSGASVGIVRCICVGGDWISVGFSSGVVSLLDVRVGSLISLRQCHESDIVTSHAVSRTQFLTASADQSVALWEVGTNPPLQVYKSFNETVHVVKTFNNEIIAGTASNRIFVNHLSQSDKPMIETKLRSDIMKGVLATLCVLPIKRQLLLASDNGSIKLLA